MPELTISDRLLHQRIRNRRIEALKLAASWPDQTAFQRRSPNIPVPVEVIEKWYDTLPNGEDTRFPEPLYSAQEAHALRRFAHRIEAICDATPDPLPELDEVFGLPAWKDLREAAQETLNVMMLRGAFSDETLKKDLD